MILDHESRWKACWTFIVVVSFNILVNVYLVVGSDLCLLLQRLKRHCIRRKAQMKQKKENLAQLKCEE